MAKRISNKKAKQMIVSCINENLDFNYCEWRGKKLMKTNWNSEVKQGVFSWFGTVSIKGKV